jgi:hypothetical protein
MNDRALNEGHYTTCTSGGGVSILSVSVAKGQNVFLTLLIDIFSSLLNMSAHLALKD